MQMRDLNDVYVQRCSNPPKYFIYDTAKHCWLILMDLANEYYNAYEYNKTVTVSAINAFHHWCEVNIFPWQDVLDTT